MKRNDGFLLAESMVGFFCLATYIILFATSLSLTNTHKLELKDQVSELEQLYSSVINNSTYVYQVGCEADLKDNVCYLK